MYKKEYIYFLTDYSKRTFSKGFMVLSEAIIYFSRNPGKGWWEASEPPRSPLWKKKSAQNQMRFQMKISSKC